MKKNLNNKTSNPVLVFSPLKRFIGYFHSLTAAAAAFKMSRSSIHQACVGPSISCCGLYFRFLANDIEIENGDYGTLRLEEYDSMCGVTRAYYPTASMSRKGNINKLLKNNKNENQTFIAKCQNAN